MNRFIFAACALVAAGASPNVAAADGSRMDILTCLRGNIAVLPLNFSKDVIDDRAITVRIRNEMPIALGGVWITYSIWAGDRPQPIYSASIRPAATIDGALLPGEQMEARDFHFMSDREKRHRKKCGNFAINRRSGKCR